MTPQIFVVVILMLTLKYTLELAGRTDTWRASRRRRRRLAPARTLLYPGRLIGAGVTVAFIGWLADDGVTTGILVLIGLALTHAGMFAAGTRRRAGVRRAATASTKTRPARARRHLLPATAAGQAVSVRARGTAPTSVPAGT